MTTTDPGVGNPCDCVLKGWQESGCQVVSQCEEFIVVILYGHVSKRLHGVCDDQVSRQKPTQNPDIKW